MPRNHYEGYVPTKVSNSQQGGLYRFTFKRPLLIGFLQLQLINIVINGLLEDESFANQNKSAVYEHRICLNIKKYCSNLARLGKRTKLQLHAIRTVATSVSGSNISLRAVAEMLGLSYYMAQSGINIIFPFLS